MERIGPSRNKKFSLNITLARKLADLAVIDCEIVPEFERTYRAKKLELKLDEWVNTLSEADRNYIYGHRHYITFKKMMDDH